MVWRRRQLGLLALALTAGCLDFVAPDLPDRGMPAILDARLLVSDDGTVQLAAYLVPGLDAAGYPRSVRADGLQVMDTTVVPDSVLEGGERSYAAEWRVPPAATSGPIELRAPALERVTASAPVVRWYGLQRAVPDSLALATGAELRLPVAAVPGVPSPPPQLRQWSLDLSADSNAFHLGANGVPPDTLVIPMQWIPGGDGDTIQATLVFLQSAVLRPEPGDYIGRIVLDTRLHWVVLRSGGPAPARPSGRAGSTR